MLKQSHATIRWLMIALVAFIIGAFALVQSPASAAGDPDLYVTLDNNTNSTTDDNYATGGSGTVAISVTNRGTANFTSGTINVNLALGGGLTISSAVPFNSFPSGIFTCTGSGSTLTCDNPSNGQIAPNPTNDPNGYEFIVVNVTAPGLAGGPFTNTVTVGGGGETDTSNNQDSVTFSVVAPAGDLGITISHTGAPAGSTNFQPGSNTGSVTVTLTNVGTIPIGGFTSVSIFLSGGLTFIPSTLGSTPNGFFTGACAGTNSVTCLTTAIFGPGQSETITFNVQAPATDPDPLLYINAASVFDLTLSDVNLGNNSAQDPVVFDIAGPPTATPPPTFTLVPTLPLPPTATPIPSPTLTFTPTLIPPPPTRTPLPRPANAGQVIPIPPTGVNVVVNRDGVNVRLLPAIGAEVLGFVNAGTLFENVEARSPDNEWLRVNFVGQQAWIGVAVVTVLSGDILALPVADPRTIPYGGFENPRAGLTSVVSQYIGRLTLSGLRLRAGPSRAYPVLANAPRYAELRLLGRTVDNTWIQVNWEGTLGWVLAQFITELPEPGLALYDSLPIDGIVADGLPISDPTHDSYMDTLRLMRARIELSQPALDDIRARWTTIALGERAQCGDYPARPSDYNIPNPVLAPFFDVLDPLQTDFNAAMDFVRQAIDLLIESCQFRQPPDGLVGEGGAAVALQAVNEADALFSRLRARLNELIPPDRLPTEEECLFSYQNQTEIVPRLRPGVVLFGRLTARDLVTGFCFDAGIGASYRVEMVKINGNILPMMSVSSFNNPTNFLGVGRIGQGETYTAITPILIPETAQYIVIVSDLAGAEGRDGAVEGEFAVYLTDITGAPTGVLSPGIALDPNTGQVIVNPSPLIPIVPTVMFISTPVVVTPAGGYCPNITYTCAQFISCSEAQGCLAAGNLALDPDADGIPCEETLCVGLGSAP
jgi:hypothetical protein